MNIISLNTWGGRAGDVQLLDFFARYKDTTDIFCLQEIWRAPYEYLDGEAVGGVSLKHDDIMVHGLQQITEVLEGFTPYFKPSHGENYGLLMFVRSNLMVIDEGDVWVHKDKDFVPVGDVGHHARNLQYVTVSTEYGPRTVAHIHGLWNGKGKGDSDDRFIQSDNIVAFLRNCESSYVLCGDFNLLPETESIKRIENAPAVNLITKYGVTSTRTKYYTKPEKFADYAFVNPELTVVDFKVLPDEVSDHAALYIEIR